MTEDLKRNPNIWIHQDGLQEDLNRSHNVTLTEAQISTILYVILKGLMNTISMMISLGMLITFLQN